MTKQKQNEDEYRALAWLRRQDCRNIRQPYSDPPDFIVDDDLAVEVTRLSQVSQSLLTGSRRSRAAGEG